MTDRRFHQLHSDSPTRRRQSREDWENCFRESNGMSSRSNRYIADEPVAKEGTPWMLMVVLEENSTLPVDSTIRTEN